MFYYPRHDSESSCGASKITETFNYRWHGCDRVFIVAPNKHKVPVFKNFLLTESTYLLNPKTERQINHS